MRDITVPSLLSTVGDLSKTFSWGPLGFDHKPAPPQRSAAPGSALQRGPDARLGGRSQIFDGVFVSSTLLLPLHHVTVFAAVVRDSSIFQTGRFVWLDGSSWIYADWLPGKPRPTSTVDNCVEVLGRTEATPLLSYFSDVSLWLMHSFFHFQLMESLMTKGVKWPRPSSAPTQNNWSLGSFIRHNQRHITLTYFLH